MHINIIKFKIRNKLKTFTIITFLLMISCNKTKEKKTLEPNVAISKPNIVVILADDFGVGDIQAHYPNNKIPTPYLDGLVQQGMSFTDAHSSSAVCSPSRYGLLTGRYPWRTELQEWVIAGYEAPIIDSTRITLPKYLKQSGYQTACIGKWHLGWNWPGEEVERKVEVRNGLVDKEWDFTKPILEGPIERGFDYFFGLDLPNLPPFTFIENDRVVEQPTSVYEFDPADGGVVMPELYVGLPMAPGWRFDQILPTITNRAVDYIHEKAKSSNPFFLYFAMTSPHEPVKPSKKFAGKSGIAPVADFVMETDWSVGQIMKALDEAGISENTIVIFTADNGHSHYTGWEDLINSGHYPSGPYRGHKSTIWEGGHRVPLIVKWPGKVESGKSSTRLTSIDDIFATCADVVDSNSLPYDVAEDSFSFLNVLLQKEHDITRKNLVSHSRDGEFAYRNGSWKLVFKLPGKDLESSRGKQAIVELYNLDEDIAEKTDLSETHPDLVSKLTKEFELVVQRGTSRSGPIQANDVHVRFDTIQTKRWETRIN